jgi:hypothetical protein
MPDANSSGSGAEVIFTGFLARRGEMGNHVRLYLDSELREWVAAPADSVKGVYVDRDADHSNLPEAVMWVKAGACVVHGESDTEEAEREILAGDLTALTFTAEQAALDIGPRRKTRAHSIFKNCDEGSGGKHSLAPGLIK